MDSLEVEELLAQAASLERGDNPAGAVARARVALDRAVDEETRDTARLALERYERAERAWRQQVVLRNGTFTARERANNLTHP